MPHQPAHFQTDIEPAPAALTFAAPTATIQGFAVACVMGYAATTQLDAVANTIAVHIHVSPVQISIGTLIGTAALVIANRRPAPLPGAVRGILVFLLWAAVSWTLSAHVSAGAIYLSKLAIAIGCALATMAIIDRPGHLTAAVWGIVLASAGSATIVLIERHTHTRLFATALAAVSADFDGVARSSGGSDQNATTAAQMLMTGLVMAAAWLAAGERRGRIILVGICAIGAPALAFMAARSAIIGTGAAAAIMLFSYRRSRTFPLMIGGAVAAVVVAILFAPPTVIARFDAIADFGQDQTLYRRVTYLRIGLDLIGQYPVQGVGPGNFPLYYVGDAYRWMPGRELIPRELHNTYLDAATELGLVGLMLFVGVLIGAVRAVLRGVRGSPELARVSFAIGAGLVALMVGAVFMPHKDMRYLWLVIALAFQCGAVARREGIS